MEKSAKTEAFTQEIKRKSVFGVVALTSRTFLGQIVSFTGTFILTILLDPSTFGVFYIVTAVVNFLNYFSDIGLAAALIQKKEEPTHQDLSTTFVIQQGLVIAAVLGALLLTPLLGRIYTFGSNGIFLYQALVISFFLSSLKTIPSIILERKLDFVKLSVPLFIETITFYVVAIWLAYSGYGVASFAWAALIRGVVGTAILYIIAPWRPSFTLNKASAKSLLSFGIPYQANSFLALVKDDLLTAFLGTILPFTVIGYIGWAKKWAEIVVRLISDSVMKVTFPTYARLQENQELLAKAINKSILFLSLFSLPVAVGMMLTIQPFIEIIPRYAKWEPALFSFYLFTVSAVLSTLSAPLFSVLYALGKVRYNFYLMIIWTVLTWTLVPLFVGIFGFNGVAIASFVISSTAFLPYVFVPKSVHINYRSQIVYPVLSTLVMAILVWLAMSIAPTAATKLIAAIVVGVATMGILTRYFLGSTLKPYIDMVFARR